MRLTDPIADMLTRIRNAYIAKHSDVSVPYSKIKEKIVRIFTEEGYVAESRITDDGFKKNIIITLKYTEDGESVIRGLKRKSTPGRRLYVNTKSIKPVLGGLGNGVVSTSSGLYTVKYCLKNNIGGEYICEIW